MKLLTGKCKTEFLEFATKKLWGNKFSYDELTIYQKGDLKETLTQDYCRNSLIIDFFDSVGIYIEQKFFKYPDKSVGFWSCFIVDNYGVFLDDYIKFPKKETRQQATEEAIKKANEIFNNR